MSKIIYHKNAKYEDELLDLLLDPGARVGLTAEREKEITQAFLTSKYGVGVLNRDAINAQAVIEQSIEEPPSGPYLMYNNLYTYVLLQGICIPYYDWIYETEYVGPDYIYKWDRNELTCSKTIYNTKPYNVKFEGDTLADREQKRERDEILKTIEEGLRSSTSKYFDDFRKLLNK